MSEDIVCPVCKQGKLIDFTDKEEAFAALGWFWLAGIWALMMLGFLE